MSPEIPETTREPAPVPHAAPPGERGPAPIGTLFVIGVLLLSIIWLWMLVLGIQQGRA
ncbi:hypothetical protein [Deinococcus koreensis]|uniref:hypothetical protein n=1 Tax=Deinococcus koreensis TaxID=2054903 RepID=UPI0013FDE24B|nr:hypothetical protein [Deinococcus koreensis]